ncbi:M20 family metallopeptidase [Gloeobacter kilaueensis]|uniref:Amidohydrolase n=1 Tax=Gloeobacter kilaueensis (strain ATCC BAA-2537 / CCAP 1431/1 / ULC 316 / JS1) TaxID=1183438 RepID=U5QRM8_GLOK1|nr:M20 family metallopeptidase [Gloeobacter kilaueensis]AGY60335.1 amidohydrolase [Gloeobacter kilaueensis JS1]
MSPSSSEAFFAPHPTLLQAISIETQRLLPRLVALRQHLHAHPELSGEEYQTAEFVAQILEQLDIAVQTGVGRTGVVGLLGSGSDERVVGIRADMDGLPIAEQSEAVYRSRVRGVMHACGHDLHTTIGLGAAMVLASLRDALPGPVKFLFQPAEETAQGARWMLDDGALTDPAVAAIFALHCFPSLPVGTIGVRPGVFTAASDTITIEIFGRAGHGARPHEAVDAIWIAANVMTSLQQGISRMHNPLQPVVLTIGQIQGGRAPNVICDHVALKGTVRSLDPQTRASLPAWIERIVAQTCLAFGADYRLHYGNGTPSVINDPALTRLVEDCVRALLGADHLQQLGEPSMGAEDFAIFCEQVPGTMFRLGVGGPVSYPLHHPSFDGGDDAIAHGVMVLSAAAASFWNR